VCLVLAAVVGAVSGCGGGSSGSGSGQQPTPDFALSLSSSDLAITAGTTASITSSVTGSNGFASAVALQIAGLPTGVTYSPASLQVNPGSPLQITFSSAATVAGGAATLTITGTSGSLTHSAPLDLTITSGPRTFRTRYTRTDAATEYFTELNKSWMVYDSVTNRFFVSDPGNNRIEVLDAGKEAEIATIPVPGAYGIDEASDHSVLFAGTQIGDVYAINPVTMQVVQRYPAAEIGPTGFYASEVRVLANGALALFGSPQGVQVDGYGSVAVWNPGNNSMTDYAGFCASSIGAFTVTGDRSLIVIGSGPESPPAFCTLNPVTGQQGVLSNTQAQTYRLNDVAPTPDGKYLLFPIFGSTGPGLAGQVAVVDSETLQQTEIFSVAGDTSSAASMIVSPDSQTLYIGDGQGIVYAYNIATGTQAGWMPNLTVEPTSDGSAFGPITNPNLQAFDGTGLLAGPMEEGVGFLDTTTLQTGPAGSEFLNDYAVPATGPVAGGTETQIEDLAPSAKMKAAYFGGNAVSSLSQGSGQFNVTTPAGSAGPADFYALMTDGGMLIVPEAFSYGPTVVEVTPDVATAEGGGTGIIYGYGLGPTMDSSPVPTDLQITVGGKSATVTGYAANAYGAHSPPFNLQAAAYTIPPGAAGTASDVGVATSSGTATASGALQYLPALQQFSLAGAVLAQGVYDSTRNLYYFTDASQIRVFSRSQGQWLTSIQVPAAPSGTSHRLLGLALSPDGTKLAVSDIGTGVIYLMNPGSPGMAQSFPVSTYAAGSPSISQGVATYPAGLAISNTGAIYYAAFIVGGDGYDGFFKLDTNSGTVRDYRIVAFGNYLYRVALTADGSQAFFNDDGEVFSVDTATDTVTYAVDDPGCCYGDYDLALSSGQTTLEATSYLYDAELNAESSLVLNDREALNISYVYGNKLSPDGTLLFAPSTNGIDVFDGRLGTLRMRISLPVALSENFDALVSDGTDNVLVAITGQTGSGIAIVDLGSVAEPAPLSYLRSQAHSKDASSRGSDAASRGVQLHRNAVIRTGQRNPITVIQHTTDGGLLSRGGATRLKPAN
jgi:WD40 repeat protein